jgi:hypothetical protein
MYGLILLLLAGIGAAVMLITGDNGKADFMAECQRHRLKYECTALWRSGERAVLPIAAGSSLVHEP